MTNETCEACGSVKEAITPMTDSEIIKDIRDRIGLTAVTDLVGSQRGHDILALLRIFDSRIASDRPVPVRACSHCCVTWVLSLSRAMGNNCPICSRNSSHEGLLPLRSLKTRETPEKDQIPSPPNPPKPFMGPRECGG